MVRAMGRGKIAPSILSADFGRLGEQVRAMEEAGADWIHVDVMDGEFVPNITIGPVVVEAVRKATKLPLDVHLMIEQPGRYVADFVRAGANHLTVHYEACTHLHAVLHQIKEAGAMPAVVLNPATPVSLLEPVLGDLGMVLIMSVNPGFGGQKFISSQLRKIEAVANRISKENLDVLVEVDGGIDAETAPLAVSAGANVLVAGSATFRGGPGQYAANIRTLRGGE
jgi:ribulose-phosphate 3-epimerase